MPQKAQMDKEHFALVKLMRHQTLRKDEQRLASKANPWGHQRPWCVCGMGAFQQEVLFIS